MDTMAEDKNGSTAVPSGGDAIGENPSLIETTSEGPASLNLAVGPPSPLTGCYLLIVIGEPYSHDHKDIILQKLLKGEFDVTLTYFYLMMLIYLMILIDTDLLLLKFSKWHALYFAKNYLRNKVILD